MSFIDFLNQMKNKSISRQVITTEEALKLYHIGMEKPFFLFAFANEIREYFKDKNVNLCSIVNAKSGRCAEDCKFCAQSAYYNTGVQSYPLIASEKMVESARKAEEQAVHMFGIVTSGTRISSEKEWDEIYKAIEKILELNIKPCASLGILTKDEAKRLKEKGLYRYHHNLETARSFFKNICSTHDYEEDVNTIRYAKEAGLSVCSGGIIGLGETIEHRIELALTLRELDVDSIPLNILNPIKGTPLENQPSLSPIEILVTIAIFRYILPDKDIKLCGGKEKNLRQLLPLGLVAGCNSLMTGNYLTTSGRDSELDKEMIEDLGLKVKF